MKINQKGFSLVEGIIVVVVLVVIAGAGYYVYHKDQKSAGSVPITSTASTSHPVYLGYKSPSTAVQVAPNITSPSDLVAAYQVLNQTSVSSNNVDSSQLKLQSSSF